MSPAGSNAAKNVLVADDAAHVRERFKVAIEQAGHRMTPVRSAAELLARVRSEPDDIDLLLLNLRLSNSLGAGLVSALRKLDDGRLPILVFAGTVGSADDVRELSRLQVAGYINEHVAPQQIMMAISPHLFPDRFNRRASPRIVLGIPVQYRVDSTIAAGVTLNLGRGGIAVRSSSPLEVGTRLWIRFKLPTSESDINADGRVAWSHRRVGMGVQFDAVDAASSTHIESFIDGQLLLGRGSSL